MNVPPVVNEAAKVTVRPGEKGNGSEHGHPLGHAHLHPHDQRHGHAPDRQQQSSVIKKRNRVVDKVAQPVPTELFDTEKLFFPMLLTGVHAIQTNFTKEKDILLTQTLQDLSVLELLSVVLLKFFVAEFFAASRKHRTKYESYMSVCRKKNSQTKKCCQC